MLGGRATNLGLPLYDVEDLLAADECLDNGRDDRKDATDRHEGHHSRLRHRYDLDDGVDFTRAWIDSPVLDHVASHEVRVKEEAKHEEEEEAHES